jgi:hypothetical protein
MKEETIQKPKVAKKEKKKVEYFTDDMHRSMFIFQEAYKKGKSTPVQTIQFIK